MGVTVGANVGVGWWLMLVFAGCNALDSVMPDTMRYVIRTSTFALVALEYLLVFTR